MHRSFIALVVICFVSCSSIRAAWFEFSDDFNRSDSSTVGNGWKEQANAWVTSQQLRLGTSSSGSAWVYQEQTFNLFDDVPIGKAASWSFNMRQESKQSDTNTRRLGVVLMNGSTNSNTGRGWAVFLDVNSTANKPLRLVTFNTGPSSALTEQIRWDGNLTTQHLSVMVTWTRLTLAEGRWDLYADAGASYADPTTATWRGSLNTTLQSHSNLAALSDSFGAYYDFNQTRGLIDNLRVVVPEPVSLALVAFPLLMSGRGSRRRC